MVETRGERAHVPGEGEGGGDGSVSLISSPGAHLSWPSAPLCVWELFQICDFKGICLSLKHQPLIPEAKVFISLRW